MTRQFNEIFAASPQSQDELCGLWHDAIGHGGDERITELLSKLGFEDPTELQRRLKEIRQSVRYRQMPAAGQARFERMLPLAVQAAAAQANRDATLMRILQLFESVSRRESYLALLEQYPQALARVAELMSASPWAAQYLTQHPDSAR